MILTYHGKGCVKATVGSRAFAFNPPAKDASVKVPKAGADVALVSIDLPDYNGVSEVSYGDREPFVIDGPGEYEIDGIFIRGVATPGPDGMVNTIYSLELDDMKLCHLGALASTDLTPEAFEAIGDVDILFLPTYGEDLIELSAAYKLANRISPKLIVPLFYGSEKNDSLKAYLKEAGEEDAEIVEKLTIKRKDIEGKEGDSAVIKSFS